MLIFQESLSLAEKNMILIKNICVYIAIASSPWFNSIKVIRYLTIIELIKISKFYQLVEQKNVLKQEL